MTDANGLSVNDNPLFYSAGLEQYCTRFYLLYTMPVIEILYIAGACIYTTCT